jgi:hypothetical protein
VASDTKTSNKQPIDDVRARLAQVIEIATLVIALVLVIAAVLVAFRGSINNQNSLVEFVLNIARTFDGPLSPNDGVFTFTGKSARTQNALANWGLAAALYLVVGRILGRVVRP